MQVLITRDLRAWVKESNSRKHFFLELVQDGRVVTCKLSLKKTLQLEKILSDYLAESLKIYAENKPIFSDEDLKELKTIEKTINTLEILSKQLDTLIKSMYPD